MIHGEQKEMESEQLDGRQSPPPTLAEGRRFASVSIDSMSLPGKLTWLSEILTLNLLSILIRLCMYIFRLPEPAWFTFVIYICHLNTNELVPCFTGVDTLSLSHPMEYSVGCS